MKVLFIAPYVPSEIRVRPYHFVRKLSERHDLTLLVVGSQRDAIDVKELRDRCRHVEVVPMRLSASLARMTVAAVRGEPLQSAVCHSSTLDQRLKELMISDAFDVVHIEHLRAARLHTLLPAGQPTVFDSVDCISLLLERTLRASHSRRQRLVAAIELRRTRAYEARLMSRFDAVLVTSSDDANALRRLNPLSTLAVIPNGVDLQRFQPLEGQREPATLVFSGKMSYHANVSAVLHFVHEILPLVRAYRPNVRLRIVGSNPPPAIQVLAHDPSITVTGHVADMRAALQGATVAICPVTVKVGIQNKVLEAMALGLPVVCSKIGAEGIAAVHGRDFLVAEDPVDFARQLDRLLGDPTIQRLTGLAGRKYVEMHHRWGGAVDKLEELYGSVRGRNSISTAARSLVG